VTIFILKVPTDKWNARKKATKCLSLCLYQHNEDVGSKEEGALRSTGSAASLKSLKQQRG